MFEENEAKELICPIMSWRNGRIVNCYASECMFWQWLIDVGREGDFGRCGLVKQIGDDE